MECLIATPLQLSVLQSIIAKEQASLHARLQALAAGSTGAAAAVGEGARLVEKRGSVFRVSGHPARARGVVATGASGIRVLCWQVC